MSWQNYVDQQLMGSGFVSKAVIAGHDGTLWAKSDNIEPSREELVKLANSFTDQKGLAMTGVHMGGEKYFYLSGTDKVIRCKKGKAGMHCMKTLQAVLIAMFEDPIQPPQVASIVESLGEYLISMTY
ncbi:profilin [Penaeus vannamei]|uniref:Profilin n=1 Tax=Penaeus vannamei TaxID=6689 RepID=A5J297_PENVA|nr:profilin-like [Penaeus vannamei]XP_027220193.1 profilin-like [Penaeus vannamei]ABI93174.1 chicadae/profilin [Penaeus vannamei]